MPVVVGPLTVMDATSAELELVRGVVARLPGAMVAQDGPGRVRLYFRNRLGAPSYAWGYCPNPSNIWVSTQKKSYTRSLATQIQTVLAHEYFHAYHFRWRRALNLDAQLKPLVTIGTPGSHRSSEWTNVWYEGVAETFAHALGFTDGVRLRYFRARPSPTEYPRILAVLGKATAALTRPTHTYRRSGRVALRQEPHVQAPVAAWAESGDAIRAVAGRSGGRYRAALADGSGQPSHLWLEVSAHNGHLVHPPLWTAELVWQPLAAIPAEQS
jgi:hypothetical protein